MLTPLLWNGISALNRPRRCVRDCEGLQGGIRNTTRFELSFVLLGFGFPEPFLLTLHDAASNIND